MIKFKNVFMQLKQDFWRYDSHYYKILDKGGSVHRRIIFLWIEVEE